MVVCVGSGGVGKTTMTAAIALDAAVRGRRVLCLTIDPAKRLANSLGLRAMTTEMQSIDPALLASVGGDGRGSLAVMMLDTKRTFDDLVTKYASSPERRDRILGNKLYQYISTSLAGTQEYMAMEKLYAVRDDERFDLVCLDTPPTSNALDFLHAPERLVGALDSQAMRWFVQAWEGAGKFSFGLVGRGAAFVLKGLSKFTGAGFLEQVAHFVTDLNDLFGGFRERARRVYESLRSRDVAFVIVTSPDPMAVTEALFFDEQLSAAGMNRQALVVNRVHGELPMPEPSESRLREIVAGRTRDGVDAAALLGKMSRALDDFRTAAVQDAAQVERLGGSIGGEVPLARVPAFQADVHDLDALRRVATHLS
ncbi:MAG: ArsA family ATPase [Deltaproteobacteria bacterium]|nr:ArsA family ATPase [Deltaproteobacteria bacterium]